MGLLDFLQSASNAVAGNVAGPVDLIALGLNKAGLPIREPVLGSEWMKKRGLMTDVPMGAARIAGETVGLLSPTVIAQKAPQIARGLLQGAENLAAPRTLNPQTGAIVWHGSPHKFDRFDSSKIGTGEGAQAYGHGLYLAESPDVADSYAKVLPQKKAMDPSWWADKKLPEFLTVEEQKTFNAIKEKLSRTLYGGKNPTPDEMATFRLLQDKYSAYNEAVEAAKPVGSLYKVDLPDTAIARMLDWDKPLSQQAPEVRKIAEQIGTKPDLAGRALYNQSQLKVDFGDATNLNKEAAQWFRNQGIPGIRYLDGGSRGAGQGTYNYVVFPGEEGLLTILERNGQRLTK